MKNKKLLMMILMPIWIMIIFGPISLGFSPNLASANSGLSVSEKNVSISNSYLRDLINQLIEVIRQLIAQLNVQLSKESSSDVSTKTNIESLPPVPVDKIFCPTVMCAAPPIGMCYTKDSNSSACGCGVLKACERSVDITLKVLLPDGGEMWTRGSNQKITWQGSATVNIDLVFPRPSCLDTIPRCLVAERTPIRIASGVGGGSYNWIVNDGINTDEINDNLDSSEYKIVVTSVDVPTIFDTSDNYFTISSDIRCLIRPMCAAPPIGMCYVADVSNPCGCGTLSTSCADR